MLNTEEVVSLLVGHKCSFRRTKDGQLYGAWVLQMVLSGKEITVDLLRPSRVFQAPPINVIEALLLTHGDWSTVFQSIDAEFLRLCEDLETSDPTRRPHNLGNPKALCHNALIAAMEACTYLIGVTALTPDKEKQFFDFLITTSFGKYSKVMEFEKDYSGRMSNCSGKLITLGAANEYFAALQNGEDKMMSGCGKQIASEFCIKRFANMPLPSKILVCAPESSSKARKK